MLCAVTGRVGAVQLLVDYWADVTLCVPPGTKSYHINTGQNVIILHMIILKSATCPSELVRIVLSSFVSFDG